MRRRNVDFSLLFLRTGRDRECDDKEMYVDVCYRSNVSTKSEGLAEHSRSRHLNVHDMTRNHR